jgi:hypothetical protein
MKEAIPIGDHEAAFIAAFVTADKRDRYSEFLRKPKRRQEILNRFNHFFDFQPKLFLRTDRTSPKEMATVLRSRGAGTNAYVIGGDRDGATLPLEEAIGSCLGSPSGAVISCIPGRLCLLLQEYPPGDAFLLISE